MSEESDVKQVKEVSLEDSFNMLVKLARLQKLSYQDHMVVDEAVKRVFSALNDYADSDCGKKKDADENVKDREGAFTKKEVKQKK